MEPHPDFPEPESHVDPCPRCGTVPNFDGFPLGDYRYVGLPDESVLLQLVTPIDPNVIPFLRGPVIAHACGAVVDRAEMVEAVMHPGLVAKGAEEVAATSGSVSVFDLDIDLTAADWSYQLASRFLTAARSCGFECERAFVSDRQVPEAPPPGESCACQLAASVSPGIAVPRGQLLSDPVCLPVFTADVVLTVDLCWHIPDSGEATDPDDADARAREMQTSLWQIMQGLMRARSNGSLGGTATVEFGAWEPMGDLGGSSRWQTRWHYRQ